MSNHNELMEGLKGLHDPIVDLIDGRPIHYVDFPMHGNIGDLLIAQGTLAFFKRIGADLRLIAANYNYDPGWLGRGQVLVMHGGGNFGDIYPRFQLFRERCVEQLNGNRIIMLPQSVHFAVEENFTRCREVLGKHPDLHIFVRDRFSYDLARRMASNVYLAPDMAHQLWPISRVAAKPRGKILRVGRSDGEQGILEQIPCDAQTDWPELVGRREQIIRGMNRLGKLFHLVGMGSGWTRLQLEYWIKYTYKLSAEAVSLFSGYEIVHTDRLHAHILAMLMSMPNKVGDNSYGKIARYTDCWTGDSELLLRRGE